FRLAAIADRLRAVPGPALTGYLASGGMLQSPMWVRLLADVLGLPVTQSPVTEATSRGAALLALEALGLLPNLQAAPLPAGITHEPDPERHARYQELRARHEEVYARCLQRWQ
ncbi:MAG TPA: FGGY-family carbohydrate kinase, partial [bacterium]|nr:FGGY-family carbohydrate kinase [bacterium]